MKINLKSIFSIPYENSTEAKNSSFVVCFIELTYLFLYFQTFVNEGRIPEQEYVTLGDLDTVRFGYDILLYQMSIYCSIVCSIYMYGIE